MYSPLISTPTPGLVVEVVGSEIERLMGEAVGFLGDALKDVESESPASRRFDPKRTIRRHNRACSPRLRILVTVSLLLFIEEAEDPLAEMVAGLYALSAARTCWGTTLTAGVLRRFSSLPDLAEDATARSIAPRRTSKRLRTSPVKEATFLVKSINVGVGRNCLTVAATSVDASAASNLRRDSRISWSCVGV